MLSVAEARAAILARARPLPSEQTDLDAALTRTLREAVVSPRAQPPFDASAMDGYAVRSGDTPGRLRVIGEAGAGHGLDRRLGPGECARIFTGAPMPEGADAVLIQEDAEQRDDVVIAPAVEVRRHVRAAGVDFPAGAVLLSPGIALGAADIALSAASGQASLRVGRRPRIAILSGGDEIVAPGSAPSPHQIFDSVSYGIAGLARSWGGQAVRGAPYSDEEAQIGQRVAAALAEHDLAIVIGGASVGDHDHARGALRGLGAEFVFEKVAMRPGKPTWFALCEGKLVLGLPGNPASAMVCARLFLRPLIERLLGQDPQHQTGAARLAGPLPANGPRETYLRAKLRFDETGQAWADCPANQDSSLLSVFAASNALVVRPANAGAASAGALVAVLNL